MGSLREQRVLDQAAQGVADEDVGLLDARGVVAGNDHGQVAAAGQRGAFDHRARDGPECRLGGGVNGAGDRPGGVDQGLETIDLTDRTLTETIDLTDSTQTDSTQTDPGTRPIPPAPTSAGAA